MNKKILFPIIFSLLLVGCDKENLPSITSFNGGSETTSVINPPSGEGWSTDEIALMNEAIGETLPFGSFSESRFTINYTDETDNSLTFYMYDEVCGDVCEAYGNTLESAGYSYDGYDDSYGYNMFFYYKSIAGSETDLIYIQIDYYPGDDVDLACFELFAWIYSENLDDTTTNYPESTLPIMDAWTDDEISYMTAAIGETLPLGPFSENRYTECYTDEYDDYVFIMYDYECGDATTRYAAILEEAGYELYIDYGDTIIYYKDTDVGMIFVYFGYIVSEDYDIGAFAIEAFLYDDSSLGGDGDGDNEEIYPYDSWPTEEIDGFTGDYTAVPSFEADGYDVIINENGMAIYGLADASSETTYTATLSAAGWTIDDSDYENYGYVAYSPNEDVCIQYFYDSEYGELVLYVYILVTEYQYDSYPANEINSFTGDKTAVPSFESTGYNIDIDTVNGYLTITAAAEDISIEETYTAILEAAGWVVDDSNYEYYGYVAFSPNEDVILQYYYNASLSQFVVYIMI